MKNMELGMICMFASIIPWGLILQPFGAVVQLIGLTVQVIGLAVMFIKRNEIWG